MAVMNRGCTVNFLANGDLSAKKYTFVIQDAATTVAANTSTTAVGLFVLQNSPKSGEAAQVIGEDETLLKTGGAVSVGAAIMSSTGGLGITATSGNKVCAIAREAATATGGGDIIRVQLVGPYTAT